MVDYQKPEFELVYFNGRGLAETSRILLAYTATPYVDKRFPLEVIDLENRRFKREEFDTAKAEGAFALSLGKVPFLRTQGVTVSQSKAIERFLAKRLNCMGASDLEGARVDAFCEHIRDIKIDYRKLAGEEQKIGLDRFFGAVLPAKLEALEKTLSQNDQRIIGNSVSLADISLFSLVDFFDDKPKIIPILQHAAPKLFGSYRHLNNLPQIQEWMATRPSSFF